jgi:hemoglobin/transferrin/lactoferrin receptor protein
VGKTFDSQSGVTAILPNPNLNPEYNYSFEAGLQKTFHNKVQVEWNAYYTIVTNLIALERSSRNGSDSVLYDGKQTRIVQSANLNQAYVYGTGIQIRADLTTFLTFNTSIQYTYGRIKTDSADYPLDHIPPVYGKTSLQLVVRKFRAEAFALYNGWKRIQDYNLLGEDNQQYAAAKGMPAWYTLNLRLGYSLLVRKQTIQVNAGCENILDRNYRTFASGISAPGRNLFVSVRYHF